MDVLGIAQASVIAHDVGSAAAQIMLANAPRRVRSLVVLDGVCGSEWAMDAIAGIQAWSPKDAHRLFPALVVWGANDEFLSVDKVGRPLAELLGARLAMVPGGHFTPLDCPVEVAAELQGFLQPNG
jgi:pimeloyl-ACP methyl ester carboxylesterase